MKLSVLLSMLLLATGGVRAALISPPRYTITDLGSFEAEALNDEGWVVGNVQTNGSYLYSPGSSHPIHHAVLWRRGRLLDLGVSEDFPSSYAKAINNRGQVVGDLDYLREGAIRFEDKNAFLWQQGRMRDIGVLPGLSHYPEEALSQAYAINDKGWIVGGACGSGAPPNVDGPPDAEFISHAFLWHGGKIRDIGVGYASAINQHGQIAGTVYQQGVSMKAVLRVKGAWKYLGDGFVAAMNDHEQVVINGFRGCALWDHGTNRPLPMLPDCDESEANAINERGQIVGEANHQFLARATLWQAGRVYDLDACIPDTAIWRLTTATGINDRGQIVGNGLHNGKPRAFLLTPRPEHEKGKRHASSP